MKCNIVIFLDPKVTHIVTTWNTGHGLDRVLGNSIATMTKHAPYTIVRVQSGLYICIVIHDCVVLYCYSSVVMYTLVLCIVSLYFVLLLMCSLMLPVYAQPDSNMMTFGSYTLAA